MSDTHAVQSSSAFESSPLKQIPKTELRILEMDIHHDPRWVHFVNSHPGALVFHHPLWLEVLEMEYGQRCIPLACIDGKGCVQGVLPLFFTRGLPFGVGGSCGAARLSSLPRTPVAGPLVMGISAAEELVRAAIDIARQQSELQLQIKSSAPYLDGKLDGITRRLWRMNYAVKLPEERRQFGPDDDRCSTTFGPCDTCKLLRFGNSTHHSRIRWSVRKAIKLGLHVRPAETTGELREWYGLYLETMRRNTIPPRSFRFFESLWHSLRPAGLMQLLLAQQRTSGKERMVAGSMLLMFGKTVTYGFSGCRKRDLPLHANDLIHWHAIHQACRERYHFYDFGEVSEDHPQLAQFKRKWTPEGTALFRYCSDSADGRDPTAPSLARRFGGLIWRRLPLRATAQLGDWFYSHL